MSRFFPIVAAALLIAGCGSPEDSFVGTWFDVEEDVTVQFTDSGTIVVDDDGDTMSGSYEVLDETQLSLDFSEGSREMVMVVTYEFDGGDLVLTAPDGDSTRMVRQDD